LRPSAPDDKPRIEVALALRETPLVGSFCTSLPRGCNLGVVPLLGVFVLENGDSGERVIAAQTPVVPPDCAAFRTLGGSVARCIGGTRSCRPSGPSELRGIAGGPALEATTANGGYLAWCSASLLQERDTERDRDERSNAAELPEDASRGTLAASWLSNEIAVEGLAASAKSILLPGRSSSISFGHARKDLQPILGDAVTHAAFKDLALLGRGELPRSER